MARARGARRGRRGGGHRVLLGRGQDGRPGEGRGPAPHAVDGLRRVLRDARRRREREGRPGARDGAAVPRRRRSGGDLLLVGRDGAEARLPRRGAGRRAEGVPRAAGRRAAAPRAGQRVRERRGARRRARPPVAEALVALFGSGRIARHARLRARGVRPLPGAPRGDAADRRQLRGALGRARVLRGRVRRVRARRRVVPLAARPRALEVLPKRLRRPLRRREARARARPLRAGAQGRAARGRGGPLRGLRQAGGGARPRAARHGGLRARGDDGGRRPRVRGVAPLRG
mmetsp:Transcript_27913/g.86346  ORF Transcript_27913/g.86346 Transcript_27913/m.86346 type:complete len:287 (+) Transcript_27913:1405-2265(+)